MNSSPPIPTRIDVLANNAGGLFKKARTIDGFEKTFQVNYLAGFLLTNLLIDRLLESTAKIIQTSSKGAKVFGHIDIDDFTGYTAKNPMNAYGDSKLANILFTVCFLQSCVAGGWITDEKGFHQPRRAL